MNLSSNIALSLAVVAFLSQTAIAQSSSLSKYDQLKIGVQKICPVTGKPLGSMGDPLKVRIGEEEIFLCCKGCTKGRINESHWITIHKNFAAAQRICPVMEKQLPQNPKSTVVNGQTVYICCPPCSKKIQAEPRKYLTKLAGYYQASLRQAPDARSTPDNAAAQTSVISKAMAALSEKDRLHATVQNICPVSGNSLGAMGTPLKVRAGTMDVFLCCEGCKEGKINRDHWATIARNIKSAQAKCPVMEKELPANAKSTVVEGQLVFVCCPPCTKKIADEPERYLTEVDRYLLSSLKSPSLKR